MSQEEVDPKGVKVVAFVSPMWNQANVLGEVVGERAGTNMSYVVVKLKPVFPARTQLKLQEITEDNLDRVLVVDRGHFESIDPLSQVESGWFKGLAYLLETV